MATLYEVYREDKRTGDKKRLGDVVASNNKIAWKKFKEENGKYTVFKR
jgi:hypothetical protein